MLFFDINVNQYVLSREQVRFKRNGEEYTQKIGQEGHDWWILFDEKWDDFELIGFEPVTYTDIQEERLLKIQPLYHEEVYTTILENYVLDGKFPEGFFHPIKAIELDEKAKALERSQEDINIALAEMLGGMM